MTSTNEQDRKVNLLTAATIIRLMRANNKTIRRLAASMNITQARVRQVRTNGVQGAAFVADWMEAITGNQTASGAEAKG